MGEYDYIARGDELYDRLRSVSKAKAIESSGYLGTFGKGFKSELTMGYGAPDEPPRLEGIGEKVAYGAGALAGMLPSFVALSTVTTPVGGAILKAGRIGKLISRLHKVGKVYKITEKVGKVEKVRDVSKLGMAVEGAAKSGALFAAHGAVHELPPGEEGVLARAKIGAEAVPMGMAFGAAAPLAGGRRLAQIGTAAGIGAGATAISGGTTEDILIQGGLLGAMSALHISVKDAHSFAKQIAGEVDKLPAEQRQAKIDDILYASREDRLDFARTKAETAPSETDLIREDRLSFAQERAKDQPMGVPGDLPSPEKRRLPKEGVVVGERPRPVPELFTAEGRPISEAAEHERIVGALDTEGTLRDAIQAVKIRDLQRQEGLIEVPGAARRPAGPEVGVRGAFGMRARPEPRIEPIRMPEAEGRAEPKPEMPGEEIKTFAQWLKKFPRGSEPFGGLAEDGYAFYLEKRLDRIPTAKEVKGYGEITRLTTESVKPEYVVGKPAPEKPERILPQTVDEARIAEEDAAVTQEMIEASREERGFAKDQKTREEFYEEAAKKGNAAQASDIIGGGIDRLVDDVKRGRIIKKDALSMLEDAVEKNITIPEMLDKFKQKAGIVEKPKEPVAEIFEKSTEPAMSSELKELHEHKARTLGFEKAGGSFVEGYLKRLARVAEKADMSAATAAYEALSKYKKGNINQASLEAEKILGKLHKAEKEALMPRPKVEPKIEPKVKIEKPEEITAETIRAKLPEAVRKLPADKLTGKDLEGAAKALGIRRDTAFTVLKEVEPKASIANFLSSKKKAGVDYEMEITVAETGETVTVKKDAAVALRETKKELSRYEKFLECLK
jgi:hypothetical protein